MTALLKDRVGAYVSDHPGRTAYEIALAVRGRRQSVEEILADPIFNSEPGPRGTRVFTLCGALGPAGTPKGTLTHKERVLRLLSDGKPHSHLDGYRLNVMLHSRVADLRRDGYTIECWREGELYFYRLLGAGMGVAESPTPAPSRPLTPPELETAKGGSTADEVAPVPGAGDVAAQPDGQLVLATAEFRKAAA